MSLLMAIGPKSQPNHPKRLEYPCGEETFMDLILKFSADDAGASAVEYGLLVACIALIIATGVSSFGLALKNSFADSTTKMFGGGG